MTKEFDPRSNNPIPQQPSKEAATAWFDSLPQVPSERLPQVVKEVRRLHDEVFRH